MSQSLPLFFRACLLFCSLNRLLPLKGVNSFSHYLTPPSLLLLPPPLSVPSLAVAMSPWLVTLSSHLITPDSDTQQLDVVCLPLVLSKDRDTMPKSHMHRDTSAHKLSIVKGMWCASTATVNLRACCVSMLVCTAAGLQEKEQIWGRNRERNPRWRPCWLSFKPKRSTLHYTAWYFYARVHIWFVKVTQSKRLVTFNMKKAWCHSSKGSLSFSIHASSALRASREWLGEWCVISA